MNVPGPWRELRQLTTAQRAAFIASWLGWTLDAFDFFLLVFVVKAIAHDFGSTVQAVSAAIVLTLAMRPLGALVFGRLAERYGRRPVLMLDVLLFSAFEIASAFAPSLAVLLVLRALFGFAMGGEWGVGSALAMETLPPRLRGLASGVLQQGYAAGYLLAALAYGLLFDHIGWRGMFMLGVLPAALALYVRLRVPESPSWQARAARAERPPPLIASLRGRWPLVLQVVLLMTAFNFLSHGTQDLYPTFLQSDRGLSTHAVAAVTALASVGAILGGTLFGALSQRWGRRRAIGVAALMVLPLLPGWVLAHGPVALAAFAFALQFFVQGAWGVVPAYLNELSPPELRSTFPGTAYQLGNLLASVNASLQAALALRLGGYAPALALVALAAALAVAAMSLRGARREAPLRQQQHELA